MSREIVAETLFARHLDLRPLRGRPRGLVRCRWHQDRTESLSVDLAQGVFHCFGCGAQGGVRRFRELVGEAGAPGPRATRTRESAQAQAWREIVARGRREYAKRGGWLPWIVGNGTVRVLIVAADAARLTATALGPTHRRTWVILEAAARMERQALSLEAELDSLLDEGRLPFGADDHRAVVRQ